MDTVTVNTELLRLIKESHLSEEDAQEVIRIFPFMTTARQIEILDDWPRISAQIKLHREQIEQEKEILLIQAIESIEADLEAYNKTTVAKTTKKALKNLQSL